ncbi:MAG: 1-acyl-sn-glycerol-3-phosphate acyltransferase [Burkholderiales bacterium]|nr:1-acyl-sn-glycerol-3-phosphate acyltransferase [Burkholderiales bacterium]
MARALLRALGWRLVFDGLPSRQGVLILYPHTSNWDFPVALLAKWGIGIPVHFWGKHTLFDWPLFGRWLRSLGGIPVLRHAPQGVVAPMIERFRTAIARDEFLWLALSPEGTRRRTEAWRSGFYQVAVGAGVPLALAFIDYPSRRIGIAGFLRLSGDTGQDLPAIAARLAHFRGKRPQQAAPIRLKG